MPEPLRPPRAKGFLFARFPSGATGVVIPHGLYDLARHRGHIHIGLSHDTSQFACDSFRWYWNRIGQRCYPDATSILLLCDCGGSNAAAHHIFKQDLQALVHTIGIEIRVADDFKAASTIRFDDLLPKWNYVARPE